MPFYATLPCTGTMAGISGYYYKFTGVPLEHHNKVPGARLILLILNLSLPSNVLHK